MTFHYAGFQPEASGFGWATCNSNLRAELARHFDVVDTASPASDLVFMPLLDHDFNPASAARGHINFAYTFFEFPLGPNAKANADKYDIVFCGSTWCLERMREVGVTNGEVLIQGVDQEIFKPGLRIRAVAVPDAAENMGCKIQTDRSFRIFSGGKFEYRKGQDLVIAAFKKFAETHSDAHLVCSWFNPWPQLITQDLWRMDSINVQGASGTQKEFFASLLTLNGLRQDQFTILPRLDQRTLACEMTKTDIGLFPNRCEGGTNLVLMEYAYCGGRVIANTETGHADIASAIHYPIPATRDTNHWARQRVVDIVNLIETAYGGHHSAVRSPNSALPVFTWSRAAHQIRDAAFRSTGILPVGPTGVSPVVSCLDIPAQA